MTTQAAVVGIGIVPFGKFLDQSIKSLSEEAVKSALDDAAIDASLIDQVYFGNSAAGLINADAAVAVASIFCK